MNLKMLLFNQKLYYRISVLLIVISIILRFVNLRYGTLFTWDQENSVAYAAREILVNHKLPLIGAKTGVGDLYLNPFYNFLITPFFALFDMDPIAGAVSAGFIAVVTILAGFLLIKARMGKITAVIFTLLWSVSPYIIASDRVPWNVNLFPLSTLLLFFGIWEIMDTKHSKGWLLTGLGIFLGATSHMSVMLLGLFALIIILVYRAINKKGVLILGIFITASLLPLVIFNIRHENILVQNIASFITNSTSSWRAIPGRAAFTFITIAEMLVSTMVPDRSSWVIRTSGILFIIVLVIYQKMKPLQRFVPLFFILTAIYFLGYSIYGGNVPEYYYLGLTTVGTVGIATLISYVVKAHSRNWVILILYALLLFLQSGKKVIEVNPHSLGVKSQLVDVIAANSGVKKLISVVFDMDLGWSFGFDYLFEHKGYSIERKTNADSYWVSYPAERFPGNPDLVFHNFALGLPQTTAKILETKDIVFYSSLFRMRVPKQWIVLSCPSVDFDAYQLAEDHAITCSSTNPDVIILNIPHCSQDQYSDYPKRELINGLNFYVVESENFNGFNQLINRRTYVTSIEQDRCIVFAQPYSQQPGNLESLLTTIRLKRI